MKKYSANNSRIGLDIFTLTICLLGLIFIILTSININAFLIVLSIIISSLVIYFAIKIYRNKVFDIIFNDNEVVIQFRHKPLTIVYSYNDIVSIKYLDSHRRPTNVFIFRKDNSQFKYTTNVIESGDEYVNFIKHVKTLNQHFKTFIWPKGTTLHSKLRQELLNVDY